LIGPQALMKIDRCYHFAGFFCYVKSMPANARGCESV
jgi:hypothetical protein